MGLCKACNLTSCSPCLTGLVDYLFASRQETRVQTPGGYLLYRRELNLAISSSPVTKTMYICLVRRTAICVGKENL